MRGLFTAGVVDALIEKHLHFDAIYGVSAGSCHAISFLSGQKDRARRVNADYAMRSDYFGIRCLIREGSMFGWKLIFDEIPNKLDPIDYDTFWKNANSESPSATAYTVVVIMRVPATQNICAQKQPTSLLRSAKRLVRSPLCASQCRLTAARITTAVLLIPFPCARLWKTAATN